MHTFFLTKGMTGTSSYHFEYHISKFHHNSIVKASEMHKCRISALVGLLYNLAIIPLCKLLFHLLMHHFAYSTNWQKSPIAQIRMYKYSTTLRETSKCSSSAFSFRVNWYELQALQSLHPPCNVVTAPLQFLHALCDDYLPFGWSHTYYTLGV